MPSEAKLKNHRDSRGPIVTQGDLPAISMEGSADLILKAS